MWWYHRWCMIGNKVACSIKMRYIWKVLYFCLDLNTVWLFWSDNQNFFFWLFRYKNQDNVRVPDWKREQLLVIMRAQLRALLKTIEPLQQYHIEVFKWGEPLIVPHYAERCQSLGQPTFNVKGNMNTPAVYATLLRILRNWWGKCGHIATARHKLKRSSEHWCWIYFMLPT